MIKYLQRISVLQEESHGWSDAGPPRTLLLKNCNDGSYLNVSWTNLPVKTISLKKLPGKILSIEKYPWRNPTIKKSPREILSLKKFTYSL